MVSVEPGTELRWGEQPSGDQDGTVHVRTTVPAAPPRAVARPGLEQQLDAAVRGRVTLVSAGPGWGKTTTVALWARRRPGTRVAWLTVEPVEDTPAAFWLGVLQALRAAGAVPPGHPLDGLRVPARVSPDLLRSLLRGVELLPEPVVLVLDDAHHLADPGVLALVEDLVRHPLPLHLVLLTRVDPPLALHRLRAQGEVAEVVAADLAFDVPTVVALAASGGLAPSPDEVAALLEETGGWAVGVRLRLGAPPDAAGRERTERSAAEYLLAEVLERQEPAVRAFLLRTSVASSLCAGLASVLDPGAPAERLLAGLAAHDGFVTAFDADGPWYRYHPLLREMLQSRLAVEDPAGADAAHRAAASWLARHGEPLRALEHAAACGDWDLFADLFVDVAAACLASPHREAVVDVLGRVPYAELEPDARLHLCAACLALVTDRFGAARDHAARARAALGPVEGAPVAGALLGVVDAGVARATGQVDRLADAAATTLRAVDHVPFPFPALDAYRALAREHRVVGALWSSLPEDAPPAAVAADPLAAAEPPSLVGLGTRGAVALAVGLGGRPGPAEEAATAALQEAARRGWSGHTHVRTAYAALAWVRLLRGQDEAGERLLALARGAATGPPEPAVDLTLDLLQAVAAASRGRARTAAAALAAAERRCEEAPVPPLLVDLLDRARTEVALVTAGSRPAGSTPAGDLGAGAPDPAARATHEVGRARLLVRAGRPDAAALVAEAVLRRRGTDGPGSVPEPADALARVEAALVLLDVARRRRTRTEEHLLLALRLAAPDQLVRPFLTTADPATADLVRRLVAPRHDALARLVRERLGPAAPGAPEAAPLLEPLTERELAILAMLPTMGSNTEIGADLFVSVNTVKAHLKALYRKLGVGSRRDAVRRGRELGLLD